MFLLFKRTLSGEEPSRSPSIRRVSREHTTLDDIEEFPTQTPEDDDESEAKTFFKRSIPFIAPKIEHSAPGADEGSKAQFQPEASSSISKVTQYNTPKEYFLKSIQRRREKCFRKSIFFFI